MKSREFAVVAEQTEIASGIFSLWLETESIAKEAVPGQFVSVYSKDKSRMLPRPISICEADKENGKLRLVYRVVGEGTDEFSHLTPAGDHWTYGKWISTERGKAPSYGWRNRCAAYGTAGKDIESEWLYAGADNSRIQG